MFANYAIKLYYFAHSLSVQCNVNLYVLDTILLISHYNVGVAIVSYLHKIFKWDWGWRLEHPPLIYTAVKIWDQNSCIH